MAAYRTTTIAALVLLTGCGPADIAKAPAETNVSPPPVNYGAVTFTPGKPFTIKPVASFDSPWALAFMPDQRMLVTEKPGRLWLVTATGVKTSVTWAPQVHFE